jgi:hypothetical protein
MTLTVQVKLTPSAVQAPVLERTLVSIDEAANQVSQEAFARFGLRGNIRAGHLGPEGSKRRAQAGSKPIVFREHSAHPMDDRCLSWNYDARTVWVWTLDGRMKTLSFTCFPRTFKQLVDHRQGESDLVYRDGKWFLLATIEEPEPEVFEPEDRVGVDRRIVDLATTSDGDNHQGRRPGRYRRWQARKRAGVPFIVVDPAYTSQMCPAPWCGHTGRGNRRTRDHFLCPHGGFAGPADEVAAVNVRARARRAWAFLNMPAPHPA